MQLNDLSLAPTPDQDPTVDLVWSKQWFVPSSTDPNGGKNFHVYAGSTRGGSLQCFVGENVDMRVNGATRTKRNRTPAAAVFLILGTEPFCASKMPPMRTDQPRIKIRRRHFG